MNYISEERIKLAKMMKHSVVTSPTYLSMVLAEPLTSKEKKQVVAIQNTRSKVIFEFKMDIGFKTK